MGYDGSVSFTFDLEDNVTPATDKMASSQDRLAGKAKETTARFDSQRIKNIEALQSLHSFNSGLRLVNVSMHELGITDDATFQSIQKVVAGIQLFTATAEMIKGAIGIINMARTATQNLAVASVFAAVAENPILGIAAVAGAGAAAYGMISLMNQSSNTSTTATNNNVTNINLNNSAGSQDRMMSSGLASTGSYY